MHLGISPSLWWDDHALLDLASKIVSSEPAPPAHLYMCVGELENRARFGRQFKSVPEEIRSVVQNALAGADLPDDMFVMEEHLRPWKSDQFLVEAHIFPQESHESIMGAALSRGLRRLHGNL